MTTWTLTTEQPGDQGGHHMSGVAPNPAEAAAALVTATRELIRDMAAPTRYTLDIDGETKALLVSGDDEHGQPDRAATLELLERIILIDDVRPTS